MARNKYDNQPCVNPICNKRIKRPKKLFRKNKPTLCVKCSSILNGGWIVPDGRLMEIDDYPDLYKTLKDC